MPLPRVVCFDLDDTLVDFSANVLTAWDEACTLAREEIPGIDSDALAREVLRVRDWYWADAERHRLGRRDLRAASAEIVGLAFDAIGVRPGDALPRRISEHYRDLRERAQVLLPGALDVLSHLRANGVGLALVTNGSASDQRAKIERFHLTEWFDHLQIEGEFGVGKPRDEVYRHVLERMGVEARDAWFVGDHLEWDVGAPQRLGFTGVWVDYWKTGLPADAGVQPARSILGVNELLDG